MLLHMADDNSRILRSKTRRIVHRTTGHRHGPITRLMSPGDLGELVKPFVFLDYFAFPDGVKAGLPVHPHSGLATHTTLLQGAFDYADSTGKAGTLPSRSVEWMQAGGGVWHGGGPAGGESLRGFQLWIALPPSLELASAFSDYVEAAAIPRMGDVRLLLGSYLDMQSSIAYREPVTYLGVELRDGERWSYRPAPGHDVAWLAVGTGALVVDGSTVQREMVVFEEGEAPIDVVAKGDVEFVIGSAAKHPYPLVTGNYSVHTSEDALVRGEAGYAEVAKTMSLVPGQPIDA